MKNLQMEIDKLVPKTWEGINWLEVTDSVLARQRAVAGLPGATRERCRQVRRMIEEGLRSDPSTAKLLGVNGLKPANWHRMAATQAAEQRVLDLYLPDVRRARYAAGKKDVEEMTPAQIGREVKSSAAWVSNLLRREGKKYRCGGLKYRWDLVAPVEWYVLTDAEVGKKAGCHNISVVAQYRSRHGFAGKQNPAVRLLNQKLRGYEGDRLTEVKRLLGLPGLEGFRQILEQRFGSVDWYLSPKAARQLMLSGKQAIKDEVQPVAHHGTGHGMLEKV
jgi:hypothetical protein